MHGIKTRERINKYTERITGENGNVYTLSALPFDQWLVYDEQYNLWENLNPAQFSTLLYRGYRRLNPVMNIYSSESGYPRNLYYRVHVPKSSKVLFLGTQANPGQVMEDMHHKARAWIPKGYQSYDIIDYHNTDYYGIPCDENTGFASFIVIYHKSLRGRFVGN